MENNNTKALQFLNNQRWLEAQTILFDNAKFHPSHETYNNLGVYLISEGLICKNGTTKNANKLGLKYLYKAAQIKKSSVNLCAIAKALSYQLRQANEFEKKLIYSQIAFCFKEALTVEYSPKLEYNYLCARFLNNPYDIQLLSQASNLLNTFRSEESVLLYIGILDANYHIDDVINHIKVFKKYINNYELLILYAKFGLYTDGYLLCESVINEFAIDKFLATAIIECCVNTSHYEKLVFYSKIMNDFFSSDSHVKKQDSFTNVFDSLHKSSSYRKNILNKYKCTPPFIERCYYYGCPIHKDSHIF